MSKPITISLQNLNSLYIKFLNQYVCQYVPKTIQNQINTLISLKSPSDVYQYLDMILNGNNQTQKTYKDDKFTNKYQTLTEKSNISYQGSTSYVSKDDFKYLYEDNQLKINQQSPKKSTNVLKRANTFINEDKTSQQFYQDLKAFKNVSLKQQKQKTPSLNNHSNPNINVPHSSTHNIVKHDFDTFSEKRPSGHNHNYLNQQQTNNNQNVVNHSVPFIKKQSKDSSSEIASLNNNNSLKKDGIKEGQTKGNQVVKREGQVYKIENNNNSQLNSKIQFTKTYSNGEPIDKQKSQKPNNPPNTTFLNSNNNLNLQNYQQFYQTKSNYSSSISPPSSINRTRLSQLINQTKEIFKQNQKKIERYEKVSSNNLGMNGGVTSGKYY